MAAFMTWFGSMDGFVFLVLPACAFLGGFIGWLITKGDIKP